MKALCYSAKLVAGYHASRNPELAKRYAITSSRISGARATLRLIDDIPMIQYALEYGFGSQEQDRLMAVLGVTANLVDLLYYPIEKICWLSEHNILDVKNADAWDVLNSTFWALSVYLNLMRYVEMTNLFLIASFNCSFYFYIFFVKFTFRTLRNYSLNQQKVDAANVAK